MLGEGSPLPLGILVGEGPGHEEADIGRPFVGATGRQLDEELSNVELPRSKLFIVNATCCKPTTKDESDVRKAVLACRGVLLRQLRQFDKRVPVLALGKWAAFALTLRDKGVMNARGFIRSDWEIP